MPILVHAWHHHAAFVLAYLVRWWSSEAVCDVDFRVQGVGNHRSRVCRTSSNLLRNRCVPVSVAHIRRFAVSVYSTGSFHVSVYHTRRFHVPVYHTRRLPYEGICLKSSYVNVVREALFFFFSTGFFNVCYITFYEDCVRCQCYLFDHQFL